MTQGDEGPVTFESFKDSFMYPPRKDQNFKFVKGLSDEQAIEFFKELLWQLGDTFDDGNWQRLVDLTYQWQVRAYDGVTSWTYDEAPFTPLRKPLSQSRLALLTSSGHFVRGDDPEPFGIKDMTQEQAVERMDDFIKSEPELSVIPVDTPSEELCVRHGGYDVRGPQCDPNVVLPLERLRELEAEGRIGELASQAYSFVGAAAQTPILKRVGPRWVELLQAQELDAVLLVPA